MLVSDAIDRLQRELSDVGQTADDSDLMLFLNNSVDWLYQTYNLPTAKRVTDLILYPGVREYALPAGFVAPIPPRRAGGETPSRTFSRSRERDMYVHLGQRTLAVEYDEDTPFLVAVDDEENQTVLDSCEDASYVTISGNGSNLRTDNRVLVSGTSSLQFTVEATATGTTTLTFALPSTFDISDLLSTTRGFFDLYIPRTNTSGITNTIFRIGNDANNYYQWTSTTRFRGQTLKGGWGKIAAYFEQLALLTEDGETVTAEDGSVILLEGTVTTTAIDWIQIVITHGTSSVVNGVYRLDSIFLSRGVYYEFPYYSSNVIETTGTGVLKEKITATTDTILLPAKCEGVICYKALEMLSAERKQESGLANYFHTQGAPHEASVKARFPQQQMNSQVFWYSRVGKF